MKKNLYLFFFFFSVFSFKAQAQFPPTDPSYHVAFLDQFDSTYHKIVNDSLWGRGYPWGQCCNVNNFGWDQAYIIKVDTDSTTTRVSNGALKLIVNHNTPPYPGQVSMWNDCTGPCTNPCDSSIMKCYFKDTLNFNYTTGMLFSKPKFRFGYFELKFRAQPDSLGNKMQGFGPDFWLFGVDKTIGAHYSEIDIFEMCGYNPNGATYTNQYASNVHFANAAGAAIDSVSSHSAYYTFHQDSNEWHKAAVWWTPQFIRFYADDVMYCNYDCALYHDPPDSLAAMNLILDINAPTNNFITNFDSVTQFPYKYEIDYVKVYQLNQLCSTDTVYCNSNKTTFESGLYNSLVIGGAGCVDTFTNNAHITGLGVNFVRLDAGFRLDATSTGYFDVKPCIVNQSAARITPPPGEVPPPDLWDWKINFHY